MDETAVGKTVQCPDCGQSVVVPSPAIQWNCQTCGHEMAAPEELEGQKVQCTECLNHVTVPVIMRALKHRDSPKCPDCGADISSDAVICVNCGLNLKTGEKIKSAFDDHIPPRRFPVKTTVIPAIAFVVLCLLAFVGWRLGTATNRSDKPTDEPNRVVPSATTASEPKPTPPADSLAIENDTRALKAVITNITSISDYASARNTLRASAVKYSQATNMKEAEALLLRLRQAVNVVNTISNCSSSSKRNAAQMLEEAINTNSMAPNLSQAQAILSKLRQELHDTDAMAMVLENARTNANRQYAIRLLKDAGGRYRQATNLDIAKQLLNSYQQVDTAGPGVRIPQPTITDKGNRRVLDKLNSIVIPQIDFRQANIVDVIRYLDQQVIIADKASPSGEKGVHFILRLKRGSTPPTITMSLRNIVLMDVIKFITKITGLKYQIEDSGVFITEQEAVTNVRAQAGASTSPLVPASLTNIMDNIAVIRTKEGSGTGFVLKMNKKKFLITNRHVIADAEAQTISFEFISGNKPTIKGFEIAKDRDLVRFVIDSSFICNGLSLSPTLNKQIGNDIIIYGNSAGVGAITEIRGKITGLGPSVIETSAEFVQGNSGSPIIDTNNNVVAVATFATRGNPKDWVTKGTRFEGVRRFGVRIDNAEWQRVNLDKFARQGKILNEARTYLADLFDIYIFTYFKTKDKYATATYDYYSRVDGVARTRTRWSGELIMIVQYYQKILQGGMSSDVGFKLTKQQLMSAPLAPKQILKNTRWIDGLYSDEAKKLMKDIDWMYAHFQKLRYSSH